jgi:hypothetical protein
MDTCRRNCNGPNGLHLLMEDLLHATPEEYAAAGSSYVAYSGRFFVDERKKSLSHEMAVSFFPNTSAMRRITTADLAKQVATPGAFNPATF